jgi:hypothetical protein
MLGESENIPKSNVDCAFLRMALTSNDGQQVTTCAYIVNEPSGSILDRTGVSSEIIC